MGVSVSCLPGMFVITFEMLTLLTGQRANVLFLHLFCQILSKKSTDIFWIEINGAASIIPHMGLSW